MTNLLPGSLPIVRATLNGKPYEFAVPADAFSILDAGLDAGAPLPYSCCAGICTSCVARCLNGTTRTMEQSLAADDSVLTAAEQAAGYVLCCQTLPDSKILELTFDEPLTEADAGP